jgi:hypothetical protein
VERGLGEFVKILLLDDDRLSRTLARRALERAGYGTELCECTEKTKEILRIGQPIILSLAKLPGLVYTSLDSKTWYDAADCPGFSGHVVLDWVGFVLDSVASELLSPIRATWRSRGWKILRGAPQVMKQERFASSSKAGNYHLPMARGMTLKQLA